MRTRREPQRLELLMPQRLELLMPQRRQLIYLRGLELEMDLEALTNASTALNTGRGVKGCRPEEVADACSG